MNDGRFTKFIHNTEKKRKDVKELIEEMRQELAIERGEKYVKPKSKPKSPVRPNPKTQKKPKKRNIFAQKKKVKK